MGGRGMIWRGQGVAVAPAVAQVKIGVNGVVLLNIVGGPHILNTSDREKVGIIYI